MDFKEATEKKKPLSEKEEKLNEYFHWEDFGHPKTAEQKTIKRQEIFGEELLE